MSVQRLGPRWLRRLTAAVGEPVVIGWANGGYVHGFATEQHRHGRYDLKSGTFYWLQDQDDVHLSSCYGEEWPPETRAYRPSEFGTCRRCGHAYEWPRAATAWSVRLLGRAIREHYEDAHPGVEVGR